MIEYFCPECGSQLTVAPDGYRRMANAESDFEVIFEYTDPDHKVWSTLYCCWDCGASGENPDMLINGIKNNPHEKGA